MAIEVVPEWMAQLDDEDVSFIKNLFWPRARSKRSRACMA